MAVPHAKRRRISVRWKLVTSARAVSTKHLGGREGTGGIGGPMGGVIASEQLAVYTCHGGKGLCGNHARQPAWRMASAWPAQPRTC